MEEKEFLTIRDTAKLLACSEKQIRRYIEKSVLKAANIGLGKRRIYRIPREAIDSFVQERMTGALKGGQAKNQPAEGIKEKQKLKLKMPQATKLKKIKRRETILRRIYSRGEVTKDMLIKIAATHGTRPQWVGMQIKARYLVKTAKPEGIRYSLTEKAVSEYQLDQSKEEITDNREEEQSEE